jgi:hypothetical protein
MIILANIMENARSVIKQFQKIKFVSIPMEIILLSPGTVYTYVRNVMRNAMANKYNSRSVVIDGYTFDSMRESQRYSELKLMEKMQDINTLEVHPIILLQPAFEYMGKTIRAITYEADFGYLQDGAKIFEDVKGFETPVFRLKWKMLLYKFKNSSAEFRIVR